MDWHSEKLKRWMAESGQPEIRFLVNRLDDELQHYIGAESCDVFYATLSEFADRRYDPYSPLVESALMGWYLAFRVEKQFEVAKLLNSWRIEIFIRSSSGDERLSSFAGSLLRESIDVKNFEGARRLSSFMFPE